MDEKYDEFNELDAMEPLEDIFGEAEAFESDPQFGEMSELLGIDDDVVSELGLDDESEGMASLNDLVDDRADAAFLGSVVKAIAKKAIKVAIKLVSRDPSLKKCVNGMRYLKRAIGAVKRRKWGTVLRNARKAYKAFKKCLA